MTSGRRGSPYTPRPEIADRLETWIDGCRDGLTVAQIAESLQISPSTLMRSIYRARDHGHPWAVRHPLADSYAEPGLAHAVSPSARARRKRRQAREAAQATAARDTLRDEGAHRAH